MRQANDTKFDFSKCLNHRLPKADLLEANCGRLWNKGKTVSEIALALSLTQPQVTAMLDGLRQTDPHLVRDEHEAPMTAKKKVRMTNALGLNGRVH